MRFFSLAMCAATTVAIGGCSDAPDEDDPIVRPVRYQRVALRGADEERVFSGTTQAALETELSFKVSGTVVQLPVQVGDQVAAGAIVAALDSQDYRVRRQEAEAGLAQARAQVRNAEAAYDRTRSLYENRTASRGELDAARAAAESARAAVNAANQQLEGARLQLSYTRIAAPQDCAVAATFVKENENVASGQPIVQLNCGDCSEISVAVPETFISRVREGSQVDISVAALSDSALPGQVTEVGVAAVGTAYPVTVALVGDCPPIRSGMAADVAFRLPLEGGAQGIVVPPVSIGEDRAGNYAFVLEVDPSGRWFARRRSVEVAGIVSDGLIVRDGLAEGELIATAGIRRITDGLEVRLLEQDER